MAGDRVHKSGLNTLQGKFYKSNYTEEKETTYIIII